MIRSYQELSSLKTFEERFEYLKLANKVGAETFGFDRYLNQSFYRSKEWKAIRDKVIVRDNGCDLGVDGYTIFGKVLIHHMNPIRQEDILKRSDILMNPNYLISVSYDTHNAIHYGDISFLEKNNFAERSPNDTCPWRKL